MKLPFIFEKKLNDMLGTFHSVIITEIKDSNGKVINRHKQMAKSLTGNFLQMLYCQMSENNNTDFSSSTFNGGAGNSQIKTIIAGFTNPNAGVSPGLHCSTNSSTYGIVLGTGNTAPTALDYVLQSPIVSGSGAGQLSYLSSGASQAPVAVGNTTTFILQRLFQNNSGGSITVSEIGLYGKISYPSSDYSMIFRDVLAGDIILNGQSYTVQISFNVTT